ncbi:hypothetical protein IWW34DRAFT_274472 [Fusarium oxysporum f. sp. albedinis]|uniref:uncharacterized protein n=1 Tax=Fusarium oxysporum Fo47 TaxID=660027 RepID=UPI0027AD1121|nr:uncharacterized protein FOBCDRAFT_34986 [Fusarium oxysporum Fo47]KAI3585004.1 hypothetical protein IWW34DRAFT_274472 [Fusarium oxysporum f. sp. albedinis]KAJ9421916.1 hypothetical protein QL093DRAFT_2300246 [Fusarium oxysporum]WJG35327.1 hypothetical protein FOBCDRAFT_34986 [Fusarium oxysporum Fo47]
MPLFVRTPCAGAELLLLLLWFVIRCCVVMSPCLLGNWPSRNRRKVIKPVSDLIFSILPTVSHQSSSNHWAYPLSREMRDRLMRIS